MKTGYKVNDVMQRGVATISPQATAFEAAKVMAEKKIGSLVLMEGDIPIGIITEQDLTRKVMAKGLGKETTTLSEIMSDILHSITSDKDLYEASVIMSNQKIKHLPVIESGELKGIISFKDLIQIQPSLIELLNFRNSN